MNIVDRFDDFQKESLFFSRGFSCTFPPSAFRKTLLAAAPCFDLGSAATYASSSFPIFPHLSTILPTFF